MMTIMGLDLSTSLTGYCIIPDSWDWERKSLIVGSIKPKVKKTKSTVIDRANRCAIIAEAIVILTRRHTINSIFTEDLAYGASPKMSRSITALAELKGWVRSAIFRVFGSHINDVTSSEARKFLMGTYKKNNQKEQCKEFLDRLGFFFDNLDEMDSFVIALFGYCLNGTRNRFLDKSLITKGI